MKRFRFMPKLAAAIVSAAMIFSGAVPAFADNSNPTNDSTSTKLSIYGNVLKFKQKITLPTSAHVPSVTYKYTLTPVTSDLPAGFNAGILAGTDSNKTATVSFTPSTITDEDTQYNKTELESGKKSLNQDVSFSLSDVSFSAPGKYLYKLTSTASDVKGLNKDSTNDPTDQSTTDKNDISDRYVVVYVTNENDGYHTAARMQKTTNAKDKEDSLLSDYSAYNFAVKKIISGNQASTTDKFDFTMTITNLSDGTKVDFSDKTSATVEKGTITKSFKLTSGSTFTAYGISKESNIVVKELGETNTKLGYTPLENLTATGDTQVAGKGNYSVDEKLNATATDASLQSNTEIQFTNTRSGTVPTGVIFAVAPFAIGAVAIAAFVILKVRKAAKQ